MVGAYILITAKVKNIKDTIDQIMKIDGVKYVKPVTGPYVLIARVEADNIRTLTRTVVEKIHRVEGVVETTTAMIAEL